MCGILFLVAGTHETPPRNSLCGLRLQAGSGDVDKETFERSGGRADREWSCGKDFALFSLWDRIGCASDNGSRTCALLLTTDYRCVLADALVLGGFARRLRLLVSSILLPRGIDLRGQVTILLAEILINFRDAIGILFQICRPCEAGHAYLQPKWYEPRYCFHYFQQSWHSRQSGQGSEWTSRR